MTWNVKKILKTDPKLKKTILISGLPGIGNVGKVVADFLVDELKAKKMYELISENMPNSVFIGENNLIELPKIEIYFKRTKKNDFLFLVGDIQPIDEMVSYQFCEKVLDLAQENNIDHIITLGGIGLSNLPEKPKLYITGNNKTKVLQYKKDTKLNDKIFGIVGPVVGVTGLLLGLSKRRKIPAVCLLVETLNHPMFLGIKGSQELLNILKKKLDLKINLKLLNKEIEEAEKLIERTEKLAEAAENLRESETKTRYIG